MEASQKEEKETLKTMIHAYLDSNILVNYCLWKYFSKRKGKITKEIELIERGFVGDFEIYISYFTLMEISSHFTDYFLMQKALKAGFSHREFKRERHRFNLSSEEERRIDSIIDDLKANKYINYIDIKRIDEDFFKAIFQYHKHLLDFIDSIHIRIAQDTGCEYFITRDGELRTRVQEMITKATIDGKFKITTVKGFLQTLGKEEKPSH